MSVNGETPAVNGIVHGQVNRGTPVLVNGIVPNPPVVNGIITEQLVNGITPEHPVHTIMPDPPVVNDIIPGHTVNGIIHNPSVVNGIIPEQHVNSFVPAPVNGITPELVNGILPDPPVVNGMPEPVNDITPTAQEPFVIRPPRPSPSQRFAWRRTLAQKNNNQAGASGVNSQPRPTPCPFPDCAKDAEVNGSGGDKKMPVTNSMMKAYVAMRAGVNSVVANMAEPLLGRLVGQEMDGGLEAPQ
jgi:hypothetical protein